VHVGGVFVRGSSVSVGAELAGVVAGRGHTVVAVAIVDAAVVPALLAVRWRECNIVDKYAILEPIKAPARIGAPRLLKG
jgi:hypothetical protein